MNKRSLLSGMSTLLAIIMAFNGIVFGHDRTVTFSTSDPGQSKAIANWGLDTAWFDGNNVRRGAVFMGDERVDLVRISFTPTSALINGDLQQDEIDTLNQRLDWVDWWTNPNTTVCINEDSPTVDAYFIGTNGYIDPQRWAELLDATAARAQARGRTVVAVAPFNEPDLYRAERLADMQTFYDTAGVLLGIPRFNTIRISGGNTLNTDWANPWYNYLVNRLDEGNTHQLAGNFDNYANFFQNVVSHGDHATNDELHNVMEAMVGAEYGMQTGIWWGTAERARGEFVKASDGDRLGYAEHRPNWTAASVYRAPDQKVQAFIGESERQALPTIYRFVALDRNVFYDGYGPQREYTVTTTGGSGYQTSAHKNAERVINITWGDDVQPVIEGSYYVVNRKSKKVMEVAGGSTGNGTNIQQNVYSSGASYQQWEINPLSFDSGGDYSYFSIRAAHSGSAADVYNWSLDDSGDVRQWDYGAGVNQQWYFEYVEDGWFYIRSRWSGKYLNVSGGSTSNGANIQQYSLYPSDPQRQQWRLIPVGADPVDFTSPATPTGLTASANSVSVQLIWNANSESDLAGYTVLRSTTNGGPYEIIARNITAASFTDNSAHQFIPYYYVVKAVDESLNRSGNSAQVNAMPTGITTLVAQYDFDDNEDDASINSNNSIIKGTATYGTGHVGSGSLVLDGSSYVSLPAEVADFDDVTIAAWVNWSGGNDWQRIFDFGNDTDYNMFLTPRSGSGTLRFAIKNGGSEQITETAALTTGTWVHVAVTLNDNTATLYVNGSAVAFNDSTTINPTDFIPVCNYIGKSQWPDPLFNGQIDDFRIYNFALSSTQIAAIVAYNTTPSFATDPISNSDGIELNSYAGESLANSAVSPDGDALTFSKDSGPDWLAIASDGSLSGVPLDSNVGLNVFNVRVKNSTGLYDTAEMTIYVFNTYSGIQGLNDLLGFAAQWLSLDCTDTPACGGADLDGDTHVNISDFTLLADNWLADEALQLHFLFDETAGDVANDDSIYAREGSLMNGPLWDTGISGGALTFDGVDDYVIVPGYKGITGTSSRTCTAWIKTTSVQNIIIMNWGDDQLGQKWTFYVKSSGRIGVAVRGGTSETLATVNDGQWHHVAAVLADDGSPSLDEVQFYIDGVPQTETSVSNAQAIDTAAVQDVMIGAYLNAGELGLFFSGSIDDTRIYDRVLTETEIQNLLD